MDLAKLARVDEGITKLERRIDAVERARGARADAGWEESKHPRGSDGKFGSGGGGASGGGAAGKKTPSKPHFGDQRLSGNSTAAFSKLPKPAATAAQKESFKVAQSTDYHIGDKIAILSDDLMKMKDQKDIDYTLKLLDGLDKVKAEVGASKK